ncbi:MAG: TRAP transporter large permease subunit [Deltaproteobacteria bacterium]|nr:TRAP transporter large permease subunit [Deltaproteobacteria bacterium]
MGIKDTAYMLETVTNPLTRYVNEAGIFFLAMMMLVTTVDVFSRFLFNLPVTGSIEITGFLLVATIMLGIPYAAAKKQHVTIDIVTSKLSERSNLVLNSITLLVGLILFSVIVWRSVEYAFLMHKMNRVTAVLRIPITAFVLIVAFGFGLTFFVDFAHLLHNIAAGIKTRKQAFLWVFVGLIIGGSVYLSATWLRYLPWRVDLVTAGLLGMALLFIAFLAGLPVFTSLIFVGFLGMCYLRGTSAGLSIMGSSPYNTVSHYTFSVIPLFVLMGEFCFFSGLGKDLYDMAYKWVGTLPGGLAMGTVVACGGFAAVCGDSMATAVTMGTVALPEMKRYKYNPRLAVGCVAAGGTLGVLIPPSLAFILYALLTDQSIATLFIAGIVPGILLISLFILSIFLRARRDPALGPPGLRTSMKEKIHSLKGVWATLILFAIVIGGMYVGVFTPTEGGGIGAFGALAIGLARRRLNRESIISSLLEAGKISAVCVGILLGAQVFGYFLAASKLPIELAGLVTKMEVPAPLILITILVIYLFLGCLMPAIPMLILTVPIFYPVAMALGYDPIWFGVIMVLMFEMAVITPPMGINVLALQTMTRDVSLAEMFRGIVPFLAVMIVCVGILIVFPDIVLLLPNLLGR